MNERCARNKIICDTQHSFTLYPGRLSYYVPGNEYNSIILRAFKARNTLFIPFNYSARFAGIHPLIP